jgi:hypothetical protein
MITVTTDYALNQKAIVDWLKAYAGVGQVLYADTETPRPPKPYATILFTTRGIRTGFDEERASFAANVIQRTTTGPRQLNVQAEVYSDPATSAATAEADRLLEGALLALDTIPVRDSFRAAKLGFLSHGAISRLDEIFGNRWERRAVCDLTFCYSGETFDDGGAGSGNWVETVQIPSELNGNQTINP